MDKAQRAAAVHALARTPRGVEALLKLARENRFPKALEAAATGALNAVQLPQLKDEIARLFPAPNALGGKPLPAIPELVKLKGDAVRGKTIFEKAETTCITCHRVGNVGVDFAPALSEIGMPNASDSASAVSVSAIGPCATMPPSRSSMTCVKPTGISSTWWVTMIMAGVVGEAA